MSTRLAHRVVTWSTRAYGLALYAYPTSFQRAYSESMTQAFRDLTRDAYTGGGLRAVVMLWARTAWDLAVSVFAAYVNERRSPSMRRAVVIACLAYVGLSVAALGFGAAQYGEFHSAPGFNQQGSPGATEDVLLASYDAALAGEFGHYRAFAFGSGVALSLLLGVASALFGLWQRSLLLGAAAFAGGAAATAATLSLMPIVWFPLDSYPVAALWVMGGGLPVAAGIWLAVTLIGRWTLRASSPRLQASRL